ncbi:MAG: xanthine dehydrogenase family protein molybdopterin-binding subunit [Silicimonas sp.]|nr:xanthine dehydrogenase family protein molybdopterin-binding subunit [Silicimonas sp.]
MEKAPQPLIANPQLGDWVGVDQAGEIFFRTGRVELGQGNLTALVMVIADELDMNPADVHLETARTDRSPNEGLTAGSVSLTFGGQALRWAASALRHLVLETAANRLELPAEDLAFRDARIWHGDAVCALSVAEIAPTLDFSTAIAPIANPKPPDQRWQAFRDLDRIDLKDRLVGAPFVHDLSFPNMLFGAPVHPPRLSAELLEMDEDVLMGRSGVVEVVRDGSFLGVVAKSPDDAARAADWARAHGRWTPDDIEPFDVVEAIANSTADVETVFEAGEPDLNAGRFFETVSSRPFLFHGSIGPAAAVAIWEDKNVTVWTQSQGIFHLRAALSMALRIDEDHITVIHAPGAGSYGHNGSDDAAFDAVLLAKSVPGRHVKVVWSRFDEFHCEPLGPAMSTRVKARLDDDGRLQTMNVMVHSAPHGRRPSANGTPNLRAASYIANPIHPAPAKDVPIERGGGADRNAIPGYDIPGVRLNKRLVRDLPYRSSSLRSLGAYTNVIAIESLIDDIVAEIGADPFEFRRKHLSDPRAIAVLDRLESLVHSWQTNPEEGTGWGIAYSRYKNMSGYCAVAMRVDVSEDVRLTDAVCVADIGEAVSPNGAKNQIEGGIIQSASWTLKEEAGLLGGSVSTESWLDYPILKFSEVPKITVELIEHPDAPPLGAGEISQGPAGAAISNAVRAALGVRVTRLPITRHAIVAALSA